MSKRCYLSLLMLVIWILPFQSFAEKEVKILIFPFDVDSQKEMAYLRSDIPKTLGNYLKNEGAVILPLDQMDKAVYAKEKKNAQDMKDSGRKSGSDWVVWGSITFSGDAYTIMSKAVSVQDKGKDAEFIEKGSGIETLLTSFQEISEKIARKVFGYQIISTVAIDGNIRIEDDAIAERIQSKPGKKYAQSIIAQDIKAIHKMGFFDDIRVEAKDGEKGKSVTFFIKEKPTIRKIKFSKNKAINSENLTESLTNKLQTGAVLNIFEINKNIQIIESMYKEKNYQNISVDYKVHPLKNNQADLEFIVKEGRKIKIHTILFEGNHAFTVKQLKKTMKTKEKGVFSFLTNSGELNNENLERDMAQIASHYHNRGYINARVGEPVVDFKESSITVTVKIDEGAQFSVGNVAIEGDLIAPKEELLRLIKINKEKIFSREIERGDVLLLMDSYADIGYANAEVVPVRNIDNDKKLVHLTYSVSKGKQVYFEKILITGNGITRDKVIRRELGVYEKELFSKKNLTKGVKRLYRLDYFEDIDIQRFQGSSDDQMILKVDVKEKPTGTFSFGGGYSSVEQFFAIAEISKRNLFGRGQILSLKANVGGKTTDYNISFTEPWLFDIPLSAGLFAFNEEKKLDTYEKYTSGGGVSLGYPVFENTRLSGVYRYETVDIRDVEADAPETINELLSNNIEVTSSVTGALVYDSRNRAINPSEGGRASFSTEYAGLYGDTAFTKYITETGWNYPLFKEYLIGFLHGKAGYVEENLSGGVLPEYERFKLGGMYSIRGFKNGDIGVLKKKTLDGKEITTIAGGDKFVQMNAELSFPLIQKAGIMGVLFYDTGNVYDEGEGVDLNEFRHGAGYGFRWYAPIGVLRAEWGYNLDPKGNESSQPRFEFSIGSAF